jgi:eukaryotic-like serine/threonine-protein kinase
MIELRTLGAVELRGCDPQSADALVSQPKRLGLLAYLAIATPRGLHRRDSLLALFWPESDQTHARGALRNALSFLRHQLGEDVIVTRGDEVGLDPATFWCDVTAFLACADAHTAEEALALYRGDLLDGFHVADAPDFDGWLEAERSHLRGRAAEAAWALAANAERAGNWVSAAGYARRAVALSPDYEQPARRLIELLDRAGDRAAALQEYQMLEGRIAQDLEVPPSPETLSVIQAIRTRAAPRDSASRPPPAAGPAREPTGTTLPTTAAGDPPQRRRWLPLAGAAIAVALALSAIVLTRSGAGTSLDANLVAVAPFDALGGELDLWREGLVDLLSRNLDGAGSLRTVSPSVVIHRWTGRADPASASALGHRTGAGLIVFGNLVAIGADSVRLAATIWDVARRRAIGEAQLRGDTHHIGQLADSLTVSLLGELGRTRDVMAVRTAGLRATSPPALKAFLEGERLYRRGAWDSAQVAYRRALGFDSTFVPALTHLGLSLGWRAGDTSWVPYLIRAGQLNHGQSRRDSLLVAADSLFAALYVQVEDLTPDRRRSMARRLFGTLEEAVHLYPEDPELWYELGESRYHLDWMAGIHPSEMLDAFDHSIALDSSFTPAYVHSSALGFELYGLKGWNRYARPYLSRSPSDDHSVGARLLDNMLHGESTIRSAGLDQIVRAVFSSWQFTDSAETAVQLGRALVERPGHAIGLAGDPLIRRQTFAGILAYRGHLREARQLIEGENRIGWIASWPAEIALAGGIGPEIADTIFGRWLRQGRFWPAGEWPTAGPPGPLMSALPWWAARRDTVALEHYTRRADSAQRANARPLWKELAQYAAQAARAYSALARGDTVVALQRFETLPKDFVWGALEQVTEGQILARQGRDAEAVILFEGAFPHSWWGPARVLAALDAARAAERLGQRQRAAAHYQFVVDVWRHADSELEPYLREARAGLERLAAER